MDNILDIDLERATEEFEKTLILSTKLTEDIFNELNDKNGINPELFVHNVLFTTSSLVRNIILVLYEFILKTANTSSDFSINDILANLIDFINTQIQVSESLSDIPFEVKIKVNNETIRLN